MRAYELDGVLYPVGITANEQEHVTPPLFYPKPPFAIITARPVSMVVTTHLWLHDVELVPELVFHSCPGVDLKTNWQYKLGVLRNYLTITHYFEGNTTVASMLQEHLPNCKIMLPASHNVMDCT